MKKRKSKGKKGMGFDLFKVLEKVAEGGPVDLWQALDELGKFLHPHSGVIDLADLNEVLIVHVGAEGSWKLSDVELNEGRDIIVVHVGVVQIYRRLVLVKLRLELLDLGLPAREAVDALVRDTALLDASQAELNDFRDLPVNRGQVGLEVDTKNGVLHLTGVVVLVESGARPAVPCALFRDEELEVDLRLDALDIDLAGFVGVLQNSGVELPQQDERKYEC